MVLCVVGHMPWEISRCTWFAVEGGANITTQVVLTNAKRSPLTQAGLEIEIKVPVIWENKNDLRIFTEKVDSVQFTIDEPYQDNTKQFCMKSSKRRAIYVCLYLWTKNQTIKLNFVLLYCVLEKKNKTLEFENLVTFITSWIFTLHFNKGLDIYPAFYKGA